MTLNQLTKSMMALLLAVPAFAEAPAIGMATTNNDGMTLDNSRVAGSATVFDGSTIRSGGYSRIHLKNGTRLDLAAGSSAQVFEHSTTLQSGMSEIQSAAGYELDVTSYKIQPAEANSVARVKVDSDKRILVTALNAPVTVRNNQGLLVARVLPSAPMAFLPQAGSAQPRFDQEGCVLQKGTSAILVDESGNQIYELRSPDAAKGKFSDNLIGNHAHVLGVVDSSATASAGSGAQQVVVFGNIKQTKKGGCNDLATKVGASPAVNAGLAVGVANGAAGGAATAAAAGASTSAGTSTGVSVVVVAGVSAAVAAGLIGAAAAGAFTSSSAQ